MRIYVEAEIKMFLSKINLLFLSLHILEERYSRWKVTFKITRHPIIIKKGLQSRYQGFGQTIFVCI